MSPPVILPPCLPACPELALNCLNGLPLPGPCRTSRGEEDAEEAQLLRVQAQRAEDKLAASESLLAAARLELQQKEDALRVAQAQAASQGGQPGGPPSAAAAARGSAGGGAGGGGNPLLGLPPGAGHAQAGAWFEEFVLQDPR